MTEQSVRTDPSASETEAWFDLAAELHRIAADLHLLGVRGEAAPSYMALNIQPYNGSARGGTGGDAATLAATDAVANALLGHPAELKEMSNGSYHHTTGGLRGRINVGVYQSIKDPATLLHERELAAKESELERLRAEVEALRSATNAAGLGFSREDDDPTPISPARVPLHVGDVESQIANDGTRLGEPGTGPVVDRDLAEGNTFVGRAPLSTVGGQ